jgi:hypothetical protein
MEIVQAAEEKVEAAPAVGVEETLEAKVCV